MKYIHQLDDDLDDYFFPEGGDEGAKGNDMKSKYGADAGEYKTEKFEGGMNRENRGCTDPICLIVFWAFIASMVYITVYAYGHGDYHVLTAPLDAGYNFCGFDN